MKIDKAQFLVEETIKKSFDDFLEDSKWQPLVSTRKQLEYILAALNNQNDRAKLNDIIIGVIAAREFETNYDEFAEMIYQVVDVVDDMKKGRI